jgi:Ca2+-dependent lipid-binding protein
MFLCFFCYLIKHFYLFSNHLKGQDTLHIDVYDKDTFVNDKIGSLQIDLQDLYVKGIFLWNKNLFFLFKFIVLRSY